MKITLIHIVSATGFDHTITVLSSLHQHKRWMKAAKAHLPWVEFKLSFRKVLVTSVLWWTLPAVELSKTPSTNRKKFTMGRLTLNILNPSSLMLTKLLKSPTSFIFFQKGVSLWSRSNSRHQPGTLETSPLSFPNRLSTSRHTLGGPRKASSPIRKSGKTETIQKISDVLITSALNKLTWTVP